MSEPGRFFFASDYDANESAMIQNNKHRNRTILLQIVVLFFPLSSSGEKFILHVKLCLFLVFTRQH